MEIHRTESEQREKPHLAPARPFLEDMELSPIFYHEGGQRAMTKQELNHHLTLLRRLEKYRKLLMSLEAADLADEAAGIRDDIAALNTEVQQSEAEVMAWIETVEDIRTRMIFRLRFLRGLEWKELAALIGGGNTKASVEKRASRYLEGHHDK